jgi:hypothetical protein
MEGGERFQVGHSYRCFVPTDQGAPSVTVRIVSLLHDRARFIIHSESGVPIEERFETIVTGDEHEELRFFFMGPRIYTCRSDMEVVGGGGGGGGDKVKTVFDRVVDVERMDEEIDGIERRMLELKEEKKVKEEQKGEMLEDPETQKGYDERRKPSTCPVCRGEKILVSVKPCYHQLCVDCKTKLLNPATPGSRRCPSCRTGFTGAGLGLFCF